MKLNNHNILICRSHKDKLSTLESSTGVSIVQDGNTKVVPQHHRMIYKNV